MPTPWNRPVRYLFGLQLGFVAGAIVGVFWTAVAEAFHAAPSASYGESSSMWDMFFGFSRLRDLRYIWLGGCWGSILGAVVVWFRAAAEYLHSLANKHDKNPP